MSRWYHAHKGKTVGPYSQDQIEEMVSQGQVGTMDLVFKVSGKEWKPLCEWDEFQRSPIIQRHHHKVDHWIVFVDRENEKKQMGPYNTDKIKELISQKKVSLDDYIWKEGMSEWYPIKTIQDFRSVQESSISFDEPEIDEDISVYEESAADLLKSIKVKDDKQIKEITETISKVQKAETKLQVKAQANREFQGSTPKGLTDFFKVEKEQNLNEIEERERQKAELKSLRAQLDEKIKNLFGEEESAVDGGTRVLHQKNPMTEDVSTLTDRLALTEKLQEKGLGGSESKEEVKTSEPSDPEDQKEVDPTSQVSSILHEGGLEEDERISVFSRIGAEFSALFPKGSLLRLFALFFLFFSFSVIIFLSSMNDKKISIEQKTDTKLVMEKAHQAQEVEKTKT